MGCGDGSKGEQGESGINPTLGGSSGETGDDSDEEGPGNGPGGEETSDGDDEGGPKYDVGQGGANFCMDKTAGVYCNANAAVECDDNGNEVSNTNCIPDICQEGQGCVECLAGQFDCMGAAVYSCNAAVNPPVWEQIEVCDPAAGMGCDLALGTCVPLAPLGGTEPTGVYYQYADFQKRMGVTDADFPQTPDRGKPEDYRGEGPYLGMRGKFTVLLFEKSSALARYGERWLGGATLEAKRHLFHGDGSLLIALATSA